MHQGVWNTQSLANVLNSVGLGEPSRRFGGNSYLVASRTNLAELLPCPMYFAKYVVQSSTAFHSAVKTSERSRNPLIHRHLAGDPAAYASLQQNDYPQSGVLSLNGPPQS
jgi:hypothetical protein